MNFATDDFANGYIALYRGYSYWRYIPSSLLESISPLYYTTIVTTQLAILCYCLEFLRTHKHRQSEFDNHDQALLENHCTSGLKLKPILYPLLEVTDHFTPGMHSLHAYNCLS